MRALLLAVTLAVLLPLQTVAQTYDTSEVIVARTAALVRAFNTQDWEAVAAIYAEDAVLLVPHERPLWGRDDIVAYYRAAFARGDLPEVTFMTFDTRVEDPLAFAFGEYFYFGGEEGIVTRYVHLWELIDGQFLLARDMYHIRTAE